MITFSDLQPGLSLNGILPNGPVQTVSVKAIGSRAVELTYKRLDGEVNSRLIYESDLAELSLTDPGEKALLAANGDLFRLVAEAYRIRLAHLFDPVLAVHTSLIEPLPHQITAVYGEMLLRQPLRFLLADDPGAGKTIMAGLLIKELMVRGDVKRCLICAPGNLTMQWQDELSSKFHLHFDIFSREMVELAVSGNPFEERDQLIVRLDQVARADDLQEKLVRTEWDLIVVDEAHKLSASYFGGEVKYTKRYHLGEMLSDITRHFLLMTATPHNGKEADFQLFLKLIDPDRFEGQFREGVNEVDVSDIMRRMIKEGLRHFDGRPLFPERRAYTMNYALSPEEMLLYNAVTDYVREEFNRAEKLIDEKRKGTVGFALMVLQRRLASSPFAIFRSLQRRREKLERRLKEARAKKRAMDALDDDDEAQDYDEDFFADLDDSPAAEYEQLEEMIVDSATAAMTIVELEAEIRILARLEERARKLLEAGADRKWEELRTLIHDSDLMKNPQGIRRKLVIFTEHRDTLTYLHKRITTFIGQPDSIVTIEGGMAREARRDVEDRFRNDPGVHFLLATDAAGEGINLQRANLMINYDLPWNPNRLEQRFGRIHRIGQTEVCHLWNLVAGQTREGAVYLRLLQKLATEGKALEGRVFDILGALFDERPLRDLLIEAVRYGDDPARRAELERAVDGAVDKEHVRDLLENESLAADTMDTSEIQRIRADMERYAARRLQPFYIKSFFLAAFESLGGSIRERETGRYQVSYVPAAIRDHARAIGLNHPIQREYERVCFEKTLISVHGQPLADFICPGHVLLDTVIDMLLEKYREVLRSGTVLVDPADPGDTPRLLTLVEGAIRDARDRVISREAHFIVHTGAGETIFGGGAPYLDYRPASEAEVALIADALDPGWLAGDGIETEVMAFAADHLVMEHLAEVKGRRGSLIEKTRAAVKERLTKEINYWDKRANELRERERGGKANRKLNSQLARARADALQERLNNRMGELALEEKISASAPVLTGSALIIPQGLADQLAGRHTDPALIERHITEAIAMQAVTEAEIAAGRHPEDVSARNLGYDIESHDPISGRLLFIEVKGRRAGADTVTLSRNEILTLLNKGEQGVLAIVEVSEGAALGEPRYVAGYPYREPDENAVSVNYDLREFTRKG